MKKVLTVFFAFFALVIDAITYGQSIVKVTRANQEQTINLSTGQVLEIQLPRKASNGYTWCEVNNTDKKSISKSIARIEDGDFIHDTSTTPNGKTISTSGTQIIRYAGIMQGTTVLTLELRRPWDKNKQVIDSYTITVMSEGRYTGNFMPPKEKTAQHLTTTSASVPSKWDWRSQCTPIADQQQCGDCWAFAGVGTFECNIKITDGVTRDISEEYLTNCDNQDALGCDGGTCPHDYWMAPKGAVYESEDPWTVSEGNGTTGACGGPYVYHETIDSYTQIPNENIFDIPPDSSIKSAIYNYGPIWVGVDASSSAWDTYSGGIFTESGYVWDHCVVLVGWCDSAAVSGGGYWIVRNSWGLGWGVGGTGYMYLSYGSDNIGTLANYLVYKGGTPHNIPPAANFGAISTSSCNGTIQFADSSYHFPATWHWDFGDGDTSNVQNPLHTYASSGTFNVTLKVGNSYGDSSLTRSNFITINLTAPPIATGASCTGPCSETLSATGSGTLNWYNTSSGGTLINTGASYHTPTLTATTTYYVQSAVPQAVQPAGLSVNTANGGYYTNTASQGLLFDALSPFTINSISVYAETTNSRTIYLSNSSGTVIDSLSTVVNSGTQSVTLNFNVPAGCGYVLAANAGCGLWRDTLNAVYPLTDSGLVSITGNTAAAIGYYYYFYNWQVQPATCLSEMVPVVATINPAGIKEYTEADIDIFPNPNSGLFDIKINEMNIQNGTASIANMLGQTLWEEKFQGHTTMHIDVVDLQPGMYYVMIRTDKTTLVKKFVKE
jgi:C1A family cysteine protease